jgi:hypothetical protein
MRLSYVQVPGLGRRWKFHVCNDWGGTAAVGDPAGDEAAGGDAPVGGTNLIRPTRGIYSEHRGLIEQIPRSHYSLGMRRIFFSLTALPPQYLRPLFLPRSVSRRII